MNKWLLSGAGVILTGINVWFGWRLWRQKATLPSPSAPVAAEPSPIPKQVLELTGTVRRGKDYCPGELYLVAPEGQTLVDGYNAVQLRSPDSASLGGAELYAGYANREVTIKAGYRSLTNPSDPDDPGSWDCFTDPFVLVEEILPIDRNLLLNDKNLVTVAGTVTCLPASPDCSLGLKTDAGVYFALFNLNRPELLQAGRRLTVSGSRKTDFSYPDKTVQALVVLEASIAPEPAEVVNGN